MIYYFYSLRNTVWQEKTSGKKDFVTASFFYFTWTDIERGEPGGAGLSFSAFIQLY